MNYWEELPCPAHVCYVSPAAPRTGDALVVRYNCSGRNLNGASSVYLDITFDNWSSVSNLPMTGAQGGMWTATNTIPAGATNALVYFNDTAAPGAGTVDNNGGANWPVSITPYTPPVAPSVTWEPAQPNGCDPVTIRYGHQSGRIRRHPDLS
jgi:hypothetical protein